MTDDQQGLEEDAAEGSSTADPRAGGRVYLVRDRPPTAGGPEADTDTDTDDGAAAPSADDATAGDVAPVRHGGRTPAAEDWPWVVEWRAGAEPTPWSTGAAVSAFSALVVGVAVWVLSAGLADRPIVAVLVNLLVAGGLAPAMWLSKDLPVLRWIAAGALVGIVGGWIAALLMLPLPTL